MKKLYAMVIGLAAMLALAATPAIASAQVTIKGAVTHTALPLNTAVTGSSSTLKFETESGNIECAVNKLSGKVTKNGSGTAEVSITEGTFTSSGEAKCAGTISLGKAIVTTNVSATHPWTLALEESKKSKLAGSTGVISFKAEFPTVSCEYTRSAAIEDKFVLGPPLIDTVAGKPEFVLAAGGLACPTKGNLNNAAFTLKTSAGEELEASV